VTLAVGVGTGLAWLLARPYVPPKASGGGLPSYVQAYFSTLGGLWTSTSIDVALVIGVVTAVVGVALVAHLVGRVSVTGDAGPGAPVSRGPRLRRLGLGDLPDPALPWLGVLVWSAGALLLIALSRAETNTTVGLDSRYTSVPALAVCSILVLGMLALPPVRVRFLVIPVTALALLSAAGATTLYRQIHDSSYPGIRLAAIGARVGAPDMATENLIYTANLTAVRKIGAYPFDGPFDVGCGVMLGQRFDIAGLPVLPGPQLTGSGTLAGQTAAAVDTVRTGSGVRLQGWALLGGRLPDCVVLEEDGVVVGGGVAGLPRPDLPSSIGVSSPNLGWAALAGAQADPQRAHVVLLRGAQRVVLTTPTEVN